MPITYTWSVANLERNVPDDGVTIVHWRCTGVDGDNSGSAYGTTTHEPNPQAEGFVPYNALNEQMVLGWVYAKLDQQEIEASIAAQIDEQANPTSVSGLPWAS